MNHRKTSRSHADCAGTRASAARAGGAGAVVGALLFLLPAVAGADTAILDDVVRQFEDATGGWYATLFPIAQNLFLLLATIELIVSAMWWVIDKDGLPEIFTAFLRRMVALSFFYVVLLNAHTWIPAILSSFQTAGAAAGGVPNISPSSLVGQGIDLAGGLFGEAWTQGFSFNLPGALVGAISAMLIFVAFVVIAAQYVVTLVELYVVIGGGVLLLGFTGSRWSMGFAEKYIGYAFATGVKLFVLLLIIGVGSTLALGWRDTMVSGDLEDILAVVAAALLFMGVAWQVPSFASAMIGGAPALTLGAVGGPAFLAGAAIATGGAAAVRGGTRALVGGGGAAIAAAQYGRAAAAASGGGIGTAALRGAGVLGGEAARLVGRRAKGYLGTGNLSHAIRERSAGDYGRAVPPPPPGRMRAGRGVGAYGYRARHLVRDQGPPASPPGIRMDG